MKRTLELLMVVALLCVNVADVRAQSPQSLLEKGIYAEETVGDLDKAIDIYRKIINSAKANRRYVAEAHFRLGMCYARKGKGAEARSTFETIITRFPAHEVLAAKARKELAALTPVKAPAAVTNVTVDVSAHLVLVDAAAVPAIEAQLKMDLDPATGRMLLTTKEAASIWSALRSDSSAYVSAEISAVTQSGVETTAKSVREVVYEADGRKGITREIGNILRSLPECDRESKYISNAIAFESVDVLGMQKVEGNPDMPLFGTLAMQFSSVQGNGQCVLLHGSRETLRRLDHVSYTDSPSTRLKDRPTDYFLFLAARKLGSKVVSTAKTDQLLLTCRFLDLGPTAQDALCDISGMNSMSTSATLTREKFARLLAALRESTEASTMMSLPVLTSSGNEAVVKWVQEVIYNAGPRCETREYGAIFAAVPSLSADKSTVELHLKSELVFPATINGIQRPNSPASINTARSIVAEPGQTLLSIVSAPEGILRPGHKCYMAVTVRLIGANQSTFAR